MSKVNATCTWGDGPDVQMTLFNKEFVLYETPHYQSPPGVGVPLGFVKNGCMFLTATEAKALGNELIKAAKQAESLDTSIKEHEELNRLVETYATVICPRCEQNWVKHGPCPCV